MIRHDVEIEVYCFNKMFEDDIAKFYGGVTNKPLEKIWRYHLRRQNVRIKALVIRNIKINYELMSVVYKDESNRLLHEDKVGETSRFRRPIGRQKLRKFGVCNIELIRNVIITNNAGWIKVAIPLENGRIREELYAPMRIMREKKYNIPTYGDTRVKELENRREL